VALAAISPDPAAISTDACDLPGSGATTAIPSSRKRTIASASGYDELTSPTKRRRLDILGEESEDVDQSAGPGCLPTAESDGTDYRFRYYGPLASTSVSVVCWLSKIILVADINSGKQ